MGSEKGCRLDLDGIHNVVVVVVVVVAAVVVVVVVSVVVPDHGVATAALVLNSSLILWLLDMKLVVVFVFKINLSYLLHIIMVGSKS